MRHDRQELILHPAGRFGLPTCGLCVGELSPLLLRPLPIGDVELGAHHPQRTAVGVADGPAPAGDRALQSIGLDDPALDFEKRWRRKRPQSL
jgi:hypothetical protein